MGIYSKRGGGAKSQTISPNEQIAQQFGRLVSTGIVDMGDHYLVDKEAAQALRRERFRSTTMSSVPSMPRHFVRDGGGMGVGKSGGRWPAATFEVLRDLRERAPILQPIHQARAYQIRRLAQKWPGRKGTVGWRVVHKDHFQHNSRTPEYIKPYIQRFERVLQSPAPDYQQGTLAAFLGLIEEDLLTINRPAVEILRSALEPGRVVQFRAVDGAVIWPTAQWAEQWCRTNQTWNAQRKPRKLTIEEQIEIVSKAISYDLYGVEYVLVRDGTLEAVYAPGDLIVAPIANRTDLRWNGYHPSHVEQAIQLIAAFMATFDFNHGYFTKGMMAEFILGLPGDLHDDDVDAFIDMFREATQGTNRAWQPPVLPIHSDKAIQKIDLKMANREMMFEVWLSLLLSLNAAIYRMDPSSINAKPWDGGQGGKLSEGNRTMEIGLAKEEGLQGDMTHITETILNPLAARCHPDLRVVWEYGDHDPKAEAEVYQIRGQVDMTRNEIRLEQGAEPMGFYLEPEALKNASEEDRQKFEENPWNMPTDTAFAQILNQRAQIANQQQMMSQMGGGQQPHTDGFGQEEDGFGNPQQGSQPPFGQPPKPPGAGQPARSATPGQPARPGPPGVQPPAPAPLAKARTVRTVYVYDEMGLTEAGEG